MATPERQVQATIVVSFTVADVGEVQGVVDGLVLPEGASVQASANVPVAMGTAGADGGFVPSAPPAPEESPPA